MRPCNGIYPIIETLFHTRSNSIPSSLSHSQGVLSHTEYEEAHLNKVQGNEIFAFVVDIFCSLPRSPLVPCRVLLPWYRCRCTFLAFCPFVVATSLLVTSRFCHVNFVVRLTYWRVFGQSVRPSLRYEFPLLERSCPIAW